QNWPHNADKPRRAAISSFGISGTNAHLILEQAPHPAVVSTDTGTGAGTGAGADTRAGAEAPPSLPLVPVALSARDQTSLAAQAARLAGHLTTHPDLPLHDIALSTATTRAHLEHRAVILARNTDDLHHALDHLTGTNADDSTGLGTGDSTGNGAAKSNGKGNGGGDAGNESDGSGTGATNGTDISTAIATANGSANGNGDGNGTHDGTGTTNGTNGANGSNAATAAATAADNGAATANPAGTATRPDTPNGNGVGRGVNIITGRARPGKTAFLYSGQGAQHPGMGRQ
ncbi:CurL C-terminal domain-containing protein, partial [Nonomuraea angiospora]|uniref:CurL C-terminal domain-containing protein n=1 Tax=Nonomuraea angiospora TaxID=46172 RepID=UPI0029ACE010